MNCIYIKHENFYTCEYCGELRHEPLDIECTVPQDPSIIRQVSNFLPAVTNYVISGRRCTQEEINSRFEICKTCPLFRNGVCSHRSCGCHIRDDNVFMNKLAWNTEQCPVGKWGVIE